MCWHISLITFDISAKLATCHVTPNSYSTLQFLNLSLITVTVFTSRKSQTKNSAFQNLVMDNKFNMSNAEPMTNFNKEFPDACKSQTTAKL
ncbi:hypothetical protein AAZV13_15G147200 [Glycine max]